MSRQYRKRMYNLYTPQEGKDSQGKPTTYWNQVGIAFDNPSGKGITLKLYMFPDMPIQLQEQKERERR